MKVTAIVKTNTSILSNKIPISFQLIAYLKILDLVRTLLKTDDQFPINALSSLFPFLIKSVAAAALKECALNSTLIPASWNNILIHFTIVSFEQERQRCFE